MNDFLSFRAMISPTLVKIVFWIGTIISFLAGAWTLSNQGPFSSTGGSVVIFLTFFVVYPIGLRVWCELTLIVFQITFNAGRHPQKHRAGRSQEEGDSRQTPQI